MRNILIIIFCVAAGCLPAQNAPTITNGIFTAYDAFGNAYTPGNLSSRNYKALGSSGAANTTLTPFCTAGYFELYAEPGSLFANSVAAQSVICEVFNNISGIIQSPLSVTGSKVRIICGNVIPFINLTTLPLGKASSFYLQPYLPTNPNQGIADGLVYKTIMSGIDAWTNVPVTGGQFGNVSSLQGFHGYIQADATPSAGWDFNMSATSNGGHDFYTIMLHEASHALGFISLIYQNGLSTFGPVNNCYSRYDQFLYDATGSAPLITASSSLCPTSSLSFNVSLASTVIASSGTTCASTGPDNTSCSSAVLYVSSNINVPVYTPTCYAAGSSLSHFEDQCYTPTVNVPANNCYTANSNSYNNLYFVMSNSHGTGSCTFRRHFTEEERFVLCDIGYPVGTTYTSNANGGPYSYSGSSCPGSNIWGIDDGFNGSQYTFTTTGAFISIPISTLTANDATTTTQISCLEIIYNNATYTVSSGSLTVTPGAGYSGLIILKYYPTTSGGGLGNATYAYFYFLGGNCNASNDCNIVQNGGFENVSFGQPCSNFIGPTNTIYNPLYYSNSSCWDSYEYNSGLFARNCTNTIITNHSLGSNVLGTAIDSWNNTPNDHIVGMFLQYNSTANYAGSSIKNKLSTTLIPSQVYQISIIACNYAGTLSPGNGVMSSNSASLPVVITIASAQYFNAPTSYNFPSGLNILTQFTLNATSNTLTPWTALTQTFAFTPTVGHSALILGGDASATYSLNNTSFGAIQLFIDDVSLLTYPTATFSIPNAMNCGNISFTNLAQYTAGQTGTFTGPGVTYNSSSNQYHFNQNGALPNGIYQIAFTYSTTCLNTIYENVKVSQPFTITPTVTGSVNCNMLNSGTYSVLIGASPSASNGLLSYSWSPGNYTNALITVSPNIPTTYTVTIADLTGCSATQTMAVGVATNCCASPALPSFTGSSISSASAFTGPFLFPNSFTIQTGGVVLLTGEILISPSVNITVASGATLYIWGAHLYSCGDMWQGITVKPGGHVNSNGYGGNDNLIEDAEVALDVTAHSNNTTPPLVINSTTFNRNYIGINISINPLVAHPVTLNGCVFTCRDFTYTQTSWPGVSTASTGLRYATSGTGLSTPYQLFNTPVANLKSPRATQRSYIALNLNNVGLTYDNGSYPAAFYHVTLTPQSDFNLYDAHAYFIKSANSNVKVSRSVFQNTQTFSVSGTSTVGAAISYSCSNITAYTPSASIGNFELDLSASTASLGNRFYDCHKGIVGTNPFSFKLENAVFRSTHQASVATNTSVISTGQTGVYMKTNQVEDYLIRNNEFSNIGDGVAISLYPANIMRTGFPYVDVPTGPNAGQYFMIVAYIHTLSISGNTFSPEDNATFTGYTNGYVKNAISVTSDNYGMTGGGCGCSGIHIENNTIYRTLNGIRLNAVNPYTMSCQNLGTKKIIRKNNIILEEDNVFGGIVQHGLEFTNSLSEPFQNGQRLQTVEMNTITVFGGSSAMSNANISLYYGQWNGGTGTLYPTPHILCNILSNANKGFVFENHNRPASWRGNKMEDLTMGMILTGSASTGGVIGQQGDATHPIDNEWNGTWGSSEFGTWVSLGSNGSNSLLNLRSNTGQWYPPNNNGSALSPQQYNALTSLTISASGSYSCGADGNYTVMNSPPPTTGSSSNEPWYLSATFAYRYLAMNDSIRDSDQNLTGFYNNLSGTSIDQFMNIEMKIAQRKFNDAQDILDAMSTSGYNSIESAYYDFYTLSLKFKMEADITAGDLSGVRELSDLCPGVYGSVVYQARALYQLITGEVYNGTDGCIDIGGRKAQKPGEPENAEAAIWDVNLFPNPNNGNFMIVSGDEKELLEITINEVTGKELFRKKIQTSRHYYVLDLQLAKGVYYVTIKNNQNESVTKKMGIAK
jgi:hypothetical protein